MISLPNPTMIYDPVTDDIYSDEDTIIPDDEGYFNGQETLSDRDVFQQHSDSDEDMYEPDFQYYD